MVIFQPYRYLTKRAIKKNGHYIKGKTIDAGAGSFYRYRQFFNCDQYITIDIDESLKPDIVCSVEKIPLPDESVDSVVCTGVLGDIFEPKKPIKEFHRILKNGKYCLLTDNFFGVIHNEPFDYFRFTNFYFERILKESGFKIIKISRIGGFYAMAAQMIIEYLIRAFNLYSHEFWGRVFNRIFTAFGRLMIFFDTIDKSEANKKFTIAWLIVCQKKQI